MGGVNSGRRKSGFSKEQLLERELKNRRTLYAARKKAGLCTRCGETATTINKKGIRTSAFCAQHLHAARTSKTQSTYKLTDKEFKTLNTKRINGCMICGEKENKEWGIILAIDHDHETERVRGLLCMHCNVTLGWFENRKEAIFQYLEWEVT